jgi:serine/threonine protein phosphatase PrpC
MMTTSIAIEFKNSGSSTTFASSRYHGNIGDSRALVTLLMRCNGELLDTAADHKPTNVDEKSLYAVNGRFGVESSSVWRVSCENFG